MHPELHSQFATERQRQDHDKVATDAEGAATLAAESVALRASETEDGASVRGELLERRAA